MSPDSGNIRPKILKYRNYFTAGLFVLAPTAITLWLIFKIFVWFDNILGHWFTQLFEYLGFRITHIPGLGALTLAIIVTFVGFFARQYVGKKFIELWESLIHRVPLINRIYIAVRQLSDAFSQDSGMVLMRPVMVQYPRMGLYSLGFITKHCEGSFCDTIGENIRCVYIPTTPNPTSGMIIYINELETIPIDMSVEDGMKIIITAGAVSPDFNLFITERNK